MGNVIRTHSIYVRAEEQWKEDFFLSPQELAKAQILPKEDISKELFNECDAY